MTANNSLIGREFVLLPDTILVLTDELDLCTFVGLELDASNSEHCGLYFDLSDHFIFGDCVLNRQSIRTKLRSWAIIEYKPQAIDGKTNVALDLFQHSIA